jgi:hypothetical protein
MTVEQLLGSMGARELQEWGILMRVEADESKERERDERVAQGAEAARRGVTGR